MTQISSIDDLRPKIKSFQLHHPLDENNLLTDAAGNPIMIDIVAPGSAAFRNAVIEINRQELKEIDKIGDPGYRIEKNLKIAAACIAGWTTNSVLGEYSENRALEICLDGDFAWIVAQVSKNFQDVKSFFVL